MTLVEPASSLTDFTLGIVAFIAAARLIPRAAADSHWRWFFLWISIAGVWGGFHHGFIVGHESVATLSWPVISLLVAIAISHLLAASVISVLGRGQGNPFLAVRAISITVFFFMVVSGNATVVTLVLTEGLTMALVIGLWVYAWQKEQPGVGLFLAAIMVSLFAAALKASGLGFTLGGWAFDPNSLYHLAQIPGLFLLFAAIQRRGDIIDGQPARRVANVAATA